MFKNFTLIICLILFSFRADAECPDFESGSELSPARFLSFEPFLILGTFVMGRVGNDHQIWQYPDLPNGGIQGVHLCRQAVLVPFANGRTFASSTESGSESRQLLQILGLVLRNGVDYRSAYPEAFDQMLQRNQLTRFPGGQMWVKTFAEGLVPAAESEELNALISEHTECETHSVLIVGNTVLIPVC